MKVTVWSLKPFFDIDGGFIDEPGTLGFDPKHPRTYPGLEVEVLEQITNDEFLAKYGEEGCFSDNVLYQQCRGQKVNVLRLTGRTSADVVNQAI